ncbi:MAG: hypothetical protein ACI9GW_001825, partial [Halieaceae bacterium]
GSKRRVSSAEKTCIVCCTSIVIGSSYFIIGSRL